MTTAELRTLLRDCPDTAPVEIVIQEYDPASGHATAYHWDLTALQVHDARLLLIADIEVRG